MKIKIRMDVEQDDPAHIKGSFTLPNDGEERKVIDWIKERLARGDVWAWALVTVEARGEIDGHTFIGKDHLGGCSYHSEENFKQGGYWRDMKDRAIEAMWEDVQAKNKAGLAAMNALLAKQRGKIQIEEVE